MALTELVTRAQKGDSAAWKELFERTQSMVTYTALGITGDWEAAQDLAQDTYLAALEKIGTLKEGAAFPGWLKMICVNRCRNYMTAKRPALLGEDDIDRTIHQLPEVQEDFLPQAYADRQETCRLVGDIVASLPEKQRATTILYYYDELTVAQIAEIMQVSTGTVKSRLNYARTQIKKQVKDMEKDGVKLYSAAPVLALLLRRAASEYTLPPQTAAAITGAMGASAAAGAGGAAAGAGGAGGTAAGAAASGAASAGGTGLLAKLLALPLGAKIAAGAVCLALVGGGAALTLSAVGGPPGGAGMPQGLEDNLSTGEIYSAQTGDAFFANLGLEPMDLLNLTEEEVVALFGEPHDRTEWENGQIELDYYFMFPESESCYYVYLNYYQAGDTPYCVKIESQNQDFYGVFGSGSDEERDAIMAGMGFVPDPVNGWYDDGYCYLREEEDRYLIVDVVTSEDWQTAILRYEMAEDLERMPIDDLTLDGAALLGLTREEVIGRLGATTLDETVDNQKALVYTWGDGSLWVVLGDDDTVALLQGSPVPLAENFGMEPGMSVDEAQALAEAIPGVYGLDIQSTLIRFCVDELQYTFTSGDGIRKIAYAPEDARPDPEQVRILYEGAAGYPGREVQRHYADLTHDGVEELILVSVDDSDGMEGAYATIYTLKNNRPAEIWQESASDMVSVGLRTIYLYRENGKAYLYEHTDQLNQGTVLLRYRVFSLTAEGGQNMLHQSENYVDYNNAESARREFEAAVSRFTDKTLLISPETYQQYQSGSGQPDSQMSGSQTSSSGGTAAGQTVQIPKTLYYVDSMGMQFSEAYWPRITFSSDGTCQMLINYGSYVEDAPMQFTAEYNDQGVLIITCSYQRTDGASYSFLLSAQSDGSYCYVSSENLGYVYSGDSFTSRTSETVSVSVT